MQRITILAITIVPFLLASCAAGAPKPENALLTVAEASDYRATSTHAEVLSFLDELKRQSELVRVESMGKSVAGKDIPLLIIADPPVSTAASARRSGKLIFFVFGAIHAGEIAGKEAILMLAREVALNPNEPANRALLDNLILVFAPIYNPDGNDRMSPDNRPGQDGPAHGMGVRQNDQGLDLNRDYMKIAAPETDAMAAFFNAWNPHITIDTHTTNGSYHQYTLTFDSPLNPAAHPGPVNFVREKMLPDVSRSLEARTGYKTFWYGNFNNDMTVWETYDHRPRFGSNYRGLRNRMDILAEAYSYAPFKDRVLCSLEFVRECAEYAAKHRRDIDRILSLAERDTIQSLSRSNPAAEVPIRAKLGGPWQNVIVFSYAMEEQPNGALKCTSRAKSYEVEHRGTFVPSMTVAAPAGYIIPPGYDHVVAKLRQHGISVEPYRGAPVADVEVYSIDSVSRAERPFQGVRTVTLEATAKRLRRPIPPEAQFVLTAQTTGNLIVYLLEPMSDDGLATWDLVDPNLSAGNEWPIWRLAL